MTPLSAHFSLEDLIENDYCARHGFDNWPAPHVLANLARLADALELVHSVLGHRLHIVRGYMSALANVGYGGHRHSAHSDGLAVDFRCPGFGPPREVCAELILAGVPFDQLILEGPSVHFAIAPEGQGMRREILTAHFKGGHATHARGLEA